MSNFIEEYKNTLKNYDGKKLRVMEVCGTHTHEIFRSGIRSLLPEQVELISGPGCPVCVTPAAYIDEALFLLREEQVTICTFGDLMRVPGRNGSLQQARAEGANIKVMYSPLDAVKYAEEHKEQQIVLLAVGFETTTPIHCLAIKMAKERDIFNFTVLTALKTMPAAYEKVWNYADAFLYPGHVHAIIGEKACRHLQEESDVSGVIAGFSGEEILRALSRIVTLSNQESSFFENAYESVVTKEGNLKACALVDEMMETCDDEWRGLGNIPQSGRKLKVEYEMFDARKRFQIPEKKIPIKSACRCGDVLKGAIKPYECSLFGKVCTPQHPVGACMVSSEGTCAAFYKYRI